MLTKQQIFDKVKNHLLTQNKKCEMGDTCLYRHGDLKCAAGIFIEDEIYRPAMEDNTWLALVDKYPELRVITNQEGHKLIEKLQEIHDDRLVEDWEASLNEIKLDYTIDTLELTLDSDTLELGIAKHVS